MIKRALTRIARTPAAAAYPRTTGVVTILIVVAAAWAFGALLYRVVKIPGWTFNVAIIAWVLWTLISSVRRDRRDHS